MAYDLNYLFAEAEASGLHVQLCEQRYWLESRDMQWICYLRSKARQDYAVKGEGMTAGEALNIALNNTLSYDPIPQPEVKITGYLQDLDSLLAPILPKVKVAPGAIRRFNART